MDKVSPGETVKRFLLTLLGSLFVQCVCWAVYDYLGMNIWMCGLSALITAVLYHFVQREEETGLSRWGVYYAAILTPFLLGAVLTFMFLTRYMRLGLTQEGVSTLSGIVSLYAARLAVNGIPLTVFALIDRVFLAGKGKQHEAGNEASESGSGSEEAADQKGETT